MLTTPDYQTGIAAAGHATLDTEQLISPIRAALINTIVSLQGSDGGFIPVPKRHKPLTKFITLWTVLCLSSL